MSHIQLHQPEPGWTDSPAPLSPPQFRIVKPTGDAAIPVVIAEDDPVSRALVTSVVELGGYRTIVTEDGDEAMEALQGLDSPA